MSNSAKEWTSEFWNLWDNTSHVVSAEKTATLIVKDSAGNVRKLQCA
ncbi:hypothetical protein [Dongia deserti]|nr:hypothetical protein [Dongia deserti]